ncbi:MAG: hypothetical protein H8D46_04905 [FCB group bacterium]|nr:hypothetical protein [FCB group bacterium]
MKFSLAILLFIAAVSGSQLSMEKAEVFLTDLIQESPNLPRYVQTDDLKSAYRLGIKYENVPFKFLISYDLDKHVRENLANGRWKSHLEIVNLDANYSRLDVFVPDADTNYQYFFLEDKLISPLTYYARDWQILESKHFTFWISNPVQFNTYSINALEFFLEEKSRQLGLTERQMDRLHEQKIQYYLCSDEDEIELITGYRTRGMSNLAFDFIITTYNTHYHELLHLLVNYKLGELPLYTHPFFQEGLAVALGGRGGKEPAVILDLGLYLQESGLLDYTDLLSPEGFQKSNASLSYPMSGLYNRFLFQNIGGSSYLELYREFSADGQSLSLKTIPESILPPRGGFEAFMERLRTGKAVVLKETEAGQNWHEINEKARIADDGEFYHFQLADSLLIVNAAEMQDYQSTTFREWFGDRPYHQEKYAIIADASEIRLYNLYSNCLLANYVQSFSMDMETVPLQNGRYCFQIRKDVFDEPLFEAAWQK